MNFENVKKNDREKLAYNKQFNFNLMYYSVTINRTTTDSYNN